jgi:Spy/CpxP family protein refolding chaperone
MRSGSLNLALAVLLAAGPLAFAQQPSAPTSHGAPSGHDNRPRNDRQSGNMDDYNIMPEGMPNLWWRIPGLAQKIGLTAEQQKRMNDIFHESLPGLVQQSRERRKQRDLLQSMLDANPPDIASILPQLDRMAQARAALEVARDKVLLNIRTVLTPEQWNKLQVENRNWQAEHPREHSNEHHDRDHGMPGRPSGSPSSQPAQPPA